MSGGAGWPECYRTYAGKPGPSMKELVAWDLQLWQGWLARTLSDLRGQAWALYQRTDGLGPSALAGLAGQNAIGPMGASLGPLSKN